MRRGQGSLLLSFKFVGRFWSGQAPLWQAFWLWGCLGNLTVWAVALVLMSGNRGGFLPKAVVLFFVAAIYIAWSCVSVWRCAHWTGNDIWTYLARGAALVWFLVAGYHLLTFAMFIWALRYQLFHGPVPTTG